MPTTREIPGSNERALRGAGFDAVRRPPGGRWIQASVAQPQIIVVPTGRLRTDGHYLQAASSPLYQSLGAELAELRASAAMTFWKFEDSLPEE